LDLKTLFYPVNMVSKSSSGKFRALKYLLLAAIVAGAVSGLWAFWWEPASLRLLEREVAVHGWHPDHDGLRLAIMADIHVGSPYRGLDAIRAMVDAANAAEPDLVVLLGDYVIHNVVGGSFVPPEPLADEIKRLRAPFGVFAVLGNHDWWYDGARVRGAFEAAGIRVLENEGARIYVRDNAFWIAGIADLETRGDRAAETIEALNDGAPILAITHNPDVFPSIPRYVSLTLAGHTHGGQVNLPLLGRLVVPSKYGDRYAYGLIEEHGKKLFVTGGVGTSILPIRFRVPPELVLLTLRTAF
jgi:predicted MPP superfamily phosphohydrolase